MSREITTKEITRAVAGLFSRAAFHLPAEVTAAFEQGLAREESPVGREIFGRLLENARIAAAGELPLCQDTGMAVVFAELGQEVRITGGDFTAAVNQGVRQAYGESFLRKSICHPLTRANTGDNTPAAVHIELVPGDRLKLIALPKGGGSENMSRLFMLTPAAGWEGAKKAVLETVSQAGPNPCPPIVLGVCLGGSFELAPVTAKHALARPLGRPSPNPETAALEAELLQAVNRLGVGPQGLGGSVTALAVHLEVLPCHIASLPLAVNIQCHACRHQEVVL